MVGACRRHMVNIWSQDILVLWLDHEPLEENECDSVNRTRASCVWWDAGVESFRYHVCLIIYRNVCCGLSQEQLHVNKLSPVLPCAWCEEWTYRGSHASGGGGSGHVHSHICEINCACCKATIPRLSASPLSSFREQLSNTLHQNCADASLSQVNRLVKFPP